MALEGLHHITAITADAPGNVDFYARVLGLRMIKKTVNFDAPDVYHLYFADETGTPGSVLTFFEFPGAARGCHGAGMAYRIEWRVGTPAALEFWARRLEAEGAVHAFAGDTLRFDDSEGLEHALVVATAGDPPLRAEAPDVPAEHALQGFRGVRAYGADPARMAPVLEALGLRRGDDDRRWEAAGGERSGHLHLDPPPAERPAQGAGSIHHIAWSAADDAELDALRAAVAAAGLDPTPIIDRQYFHSVYFRTASGVLFELATRDIGFAIDEPVQSLGAALTLPPQHEHRRAQLERTLTPLLNPRTAAPG